MKIKAVMIALSMINGKPPYIIQVTLTAIVCGELYVYFFVILAGD